MKPRAITEGALITAIAVVLALGCYYIPILYLFYVLVPTPIAVLARRQGVGTAAVSALAAGAITFLFIDPLTAATYMLYFVFVGVSLGWCYANEKNGFTRMVVGYLGAFITVMLSIVIISAVSGINIMTQIGEAIDLSSGQAVEIYRSALPADQVGALSESVKTLAAQMKMMMPAVFLILPFFIAWFNVLLSDFILIRTRNRIEPLRPISRWEAPVSLQVFMALMLVVTIVLQLMPANTVPQIYSTTISVLSDMVFTLQGFSFVFWFIFRKRPKESLLVKVIVVFIVMTVPFASLILRFIGIFDMFSGIRKIIAYRDGDSQ